MNAHAGNYEQILNQRPTALTRCVSAGLPRTPPPRLRARTWGPPTCQMRCGVGLVGPPLWRESQRSEGEVEAGVRTSLGWVIDSIPWWQPRPFRSDRTSASHAWGRGACGLWAHFANCIGQWRVGPVWEPSPGTRTLTHLALAAPSLLCLSPENAERPGVRTCGAHAWAPLRLTCRPWARLRRAPRATCRTSPLPHLVPTRGLGSSRHKRTREERLPGIQCTHVRDAFHGVWHVISTLREGLLNK